MKTRVTFRLPDPLAQTLRELPNQTKFVEDALARALLDVCPACGGSGRRSRPSLEVSDFRSGSLPRLRRDEALRLKELVRSARTMGATRLALRHDEAVFEFELMRGDAVLLSGTFGADGARLN